MPRREGAAHVVTTKRVYKGRVYETHLLRRTYRQGGKVKNLTLANLSHLPKHVIELVRGALRGEKFLPAESA
ncbi:MAG: IS1634 family transposase, partial [Bryobacteraceae bacterium]